MKKLAIWNIVLLFAILGLSLEFQRIVSQQESQNNIFAKVPTDQIHTMRIWEDGSWEIEYQDDTSETGCLETGLCND